MANNMKSFQNTMFIQSTTENNKCLIKIMLISLKWAIPFARKLYFKYIYNDIQTETV